MFRSLAVRSLAASVVTSSRRTRRVAAVGLLSAGLTATALAGSVGPASALANPPTIIVTAHVHGVSVSGPSTIHAGRYKFHISSTVPVDQEGNGGSDVEIISLKPGVSFNQFKADIAPALGENSSPPATVASIRKVNAEARAFGGAQLGPGQLANNTVTLSAGTYYITDFTTGQVTTRHVVGSITPTTVPATNAHLSFISVGKYMRFGTPGVLPQNASYLVRNDTDELHFLEFQPVAPGTTDQQVANFFNSIVHGQNPGQPPFTGPPIGTGAISPGNEVVWAAHLPPGTYVELCFVPDDMTGLPHAFMGMHTVVHVQ